MQNQFKQGMDLIRNEDKIEKKLQDILLSEEIAGSEVLVRKAYLQLLDFSIKINKPELVNEALDKCEIVLNELSLATESVLSILLKTLADHSAISKEECEQNYGKPVWKLITDLQKIDQLDTTKYHSNAENFIKLLLTISDDIRAVLIKLTERLFEMRFLENSDPEKQHSIAGETSILYIPITHRLGLYKINKELEDLVMKFTNTEIYEDIEQKIKETQKDRDKFIHDFIHPIESILAENGMNCEIKGRVKSIPSIWRKMKVQKVEFEKVYDLFAIRIIVNETQENEKSDCWKVYSLVTNIYTPNPRRLRDWISFPKSTGYESLHTTVIGPEGKWVEIQIRTRRMDDVAERGFAAHWKYKNNYKKNTRTEWFAEIRSLLEKPEQSSLEKAINDEKRALYTDEIFIFTPKGDLKRLRAGYTVLDFAFEIHSDVGSTCTGAIVNSKMVPFKHVLQNGDRVKIMTSKNQKPSHDWLDIVKSPRTINRIKHVLKMEAYKEADLGKEILRNKIIQLGFEFNDVTVNKLIEYFKCENFLELYQGFGEQKFDLIKIKKALTEVEEKPIIEQEIIEETFSEQFSHVRSGKQDYLIIENSPDAMHYQFAKCCNPIMGDRIFAFVSVSQGIRIHKTFCPNAKDLITRYPYRILVAKWKQVEEKGAFTANLKITGRYSQDVINKLTHTLTYELKVNVRSVRLDPQNDNNYKGELGIYVTSKSHLEKIMNQMLKLKYVYSVERMGAG